MSRRSRRDPREATSKPANEAPKASEGGTMFKKVFSAVSGALDKAGDVGGLWQIFEKIFQRVPEPIRKELTEKLPVFLGLSKKDEGLWIRIRARLAELGSKERKDYVGAIASLMVIMQDYQRRYFRYCVVQAYTDAAKPSKMKKVPKPVLDEDGRQVKDKGGRVQMAVHEEPVDGSDENAAIVFLVGLAKEVKKIGAAAVLDRMLNEQLTIKEPLLKQFTDGAKKFEQFVLNPLGVTSAADLLQSNVRDLEQKSQDFRAESKKWAKRLSFGLLR